MKIIQIIPNLLVAGAERFVVDLSNRLQQEGHEVHIILFFNNDFIQQPLLQQVNPSIRIHFLDKRLGFDLDVFKRLRRLIKDIKADIVHTHVGAFNYTAIISLLLSKLKIVHTVHSDAEKEASGKVSMLVRKFFFRRRNFYPVTISVECSNSFKKVYPGCNYRMILNGREKELPGPRYMQIKHEVAKMKNERQDCAVFLFVGRLMSVKQPQLLVNAFRMLDLSRRPAILILIGRGADPTIVGLVNDAMKTSNNIFYIGERDNVTDYMSEADFFCLSSLYEGMPISLIEAFANGLIPISTPVGGVPEMVKDLGFLSLDNHTSEAYKVALQQALDMPQDKSERFKQEIKKEFISKYTMDKCATEYIKLYREILDYTL